MYLYDYFLKNVKLQQDVYVKFQCSAISSFLIKNTFWKKKHIGRQQKIKLYKKLVIPIFLFLRVSFIVGNLKYSRFLPELPVYYHNILFFWNQNQSQCSMDSHICSTSDKGPLTNKFLRAWYMWIYHRLVFINCFISIIYVGNAKYASSFVSDDNLLMFLSDNDGCSL